MNIEELQHAILHERNKMPPKIHGKSYIQLTGLRLNMARMNYK